MADDEEDFYALLGVDAGASSEAIRKAYRQAAVRWHPDKNPDDPRRAEVMFKKVAAAYEVLGDETRRAEYDRFGRSSRDPRGGANGAGRSASSHGAGATGPGRAGGGFGGFGGGSEEPETPKGDSFVIDLDVSIRDLYLGRVIRVARDKSVIKPAKGKRKCNCKQRMVTKQIGPGMFQQYAKEECEECPNVKLGRESETIAIEIEPGAPDGHEMLFFEEGEPIVDGEPGDLRVRVRTAKDDRFERHGNDLHMTFRVDLVEALAGFDKAFTHFDGREVRVKRDGITTPGLVETIAKEGMPVHNQHKKFGNLVVTYEVDFPKKLTEKQKGEVKKLFAGTF